MRAIILAAGLGNRMRPLTDVTPKPLLEVNEKPLIVYHIEKLAKNGFKEIVINIAHLGAQISDALGDGSAWNVKIFYSDERDEGALESAGGIVKALPLLGDTFLVVNGDVWCDYDFDSNFDLGEDSAHLILVNNPSHNLDGDFAIDGSRARLDGDTKYTFSGISYYKSELFKNVAYGKSALAPLLREYIKEDKISAEVYDGIWKDIGTPQRLEEVNAGS